SCIYSRYIDEIGYGPISADALVTRPHEVAVHTTVLPTDTFNISRCTQDVVYGWETCVSGVGGGPIDITVTAIDGYYWRSSGGYHTYSPNFTFRTEGSSTSRVAAVTGSVVGTPFTDPRAGAGINYTHGVTVTITRNPPSGCTQDTGSCNSDSDCCA